MNNHVMLDLETLGTRPGSIIASIGAARFADGQILDQFHVRLDVNHEIWGLFGFTTDADTVMWWDKQSDAAKQELRGTAHPLLALDEFRDWALKPGPVDTIWGNGAMLDNSLLSEAYLRIVGTRPWGYRADRCYRTVKALYPQIKAADYGTEHVAVDDAIKQARHLMRMIAI